MQLGVKALSYMPVKHMSSSLCVEKILAKASIPLKWGAWHFNKAYYRVEENETTNWRAVLYNFDQFIAT
jgi:hypothetical protein